MNAWIRRGLPLAVFSAGMLILGTGIASAADGNTTGGGQTGPAGSLLSLPLSAAGGTTDAGTDGSTGAAEHVLDLDIDGMIDVSADHLADVPGLLDIDLTGALDASGDHRIGADVDGDIAVGSETAPLVTVPIAIHDTAIAVGDHGGDGTHGNNAAAAPPARSSDDPRAGSIANIPVSVSGTSAGILGRVADDGPAPSAGSARAPADSSPTAPESLLYAPVTLCGIGVGVLADVSSAPCSGQSGSGSGLVSAPVVVCGVTAAILGNAEASCPGQAGPGGFHLVSVPVTLCGPSLSVAGATGVTCGTGAATPPMPAETDPADGSGSIGDAAGPGAWSAGTDPSAVAGPDSPVLNSVSPADAGEQAATGLAYTGTDVSALVGWGLLLLLFGSATLSRTIRGRQHVGVGLG